MNVIKLFLSASVLVASVLALTAQASGQPRYQPISVDNIFPERSALPMVIREDIVDHIRSECPKVRGAKYLGTKVTTEVDQYSDAWREHLYETTLQVTFNYDYEPDNIGVMVFTSDHYIGRATGEETFLLQRVSSDNPLICFKGL